MYVNMEVGTLRDIPIENLRFVCNELDKSNDLERFAHALRDMAMDITPIEIDNLHNAGYSPCSYFFKVLQCRQPKLKTKTFMEMLAEIERHDVLEIMRGKNLPKIFFDIPFRKQEELALYLNVRTRNWKTMAGKIGYSDEEISEMELNKPTKKKSPMEHLIMIINQRHPHMKTDVFKRVLSTIRRNDLVHFLDNLSSMA